MTDNPDFTSPVRVKATITRTQVFEKEFVVPAGTTHEDFRKKVIREGNEAARFEWNVAHDDVQYERIED